MLLAAETNERTTNRKGMSTKCLDHTRQRNWRAFVLWVYLPMDNQQRRRRSARAAPKSTRTTHLVTLGGWTESNLSMGHGLGGLRVWCGQLCCRRRAALKGESGLSPNEMRRRRKAYMRGVRHAARAFTSAVLDIGRYRRKLEDGWSSGWR